MGVIFLSANRPFSSVSFCFVRAQCFPSGCLHCDSIWVHIAYPGDFVVVGMRYMKTGCEPAIYRVSFQSNLFPSNFYFDLCNNWKIERIFFFVHVAARGCTPYRDWVVSWSLNFFLHSVSFVVLNECLAATCSSTIHTFSCVVLRNQISQRYEKVIRKLEATWLHCCQNQFSTRLYSKQTHVVF